MMVFLGFCDIALVFQLDLVLCMRDKFFNCHTLGGDIGDGNGKHCTPDISTALERRVDASIEIITTGGKNICLSRKKFTWPEATKHEQLARSTGKFIDLEKYLMFSMS